MIEAMLCLVVAIADGDTLTARCDAKWLSGVACSGGPN